MYKEIPAQQWYGEPGTQLGPIRTGSQRIKRMVSEGNDFGSTNRMIKKQEDLSDVMEKAYVSS